jgi:DivIVA domain-containing protein
MSDLKGVLLSDQINPAGLKNKEFRKTVWGYNPQEVVDYLDAVAKTWEKVQKHEKSLVEEIKVLGLEIEAWKAREGEFKILLEKTKIEADGIREKAILEAEALLKEVRDKAEDVRQKTESWLATVIAEVEETEKRREKFVSEFKTSLDQHYALLEGEEAPSKPLHSHLTKFLSSKSKMREPSPILEN